MVDPIPLGPVSRTTNSVRISVPPRPASAAPEARDPAGTAESLPRLLTLAAAVAAKGPPIDTARITQLRQAIADGSYTIDPDLIAQSMLAFHDNHHK
jgi:negative regulator of flagellin synthesis FlgM